VRYRIRKKMRRATMNSGNQRKVSVAPGRR